MPKGLAEVYRCRICGATKKAAAAKCTSCIMPPSQKGRAASSARKIDSDNDSDSDDYKAALERQKQENGPSTDELQATIRSLKEVLASRSPARRKCLFEVELHRRSKAHAISKALCFYEERNDFEQALSASNTKIEKLEKAIKKLANSKKKYKDFIAGQWEGVFKTASTTEDLE